MIKQEIFQIHVYQVKTASRNFSAVISYHLNRNENKCKQKQSNSMEWAHFHNLTGKYQMFGIFVAFHILVRIASFAKEMEFIKYLNSIIQNI